MAKRKSVKRKGKSSSKNKIVPLYVEFLKKFKDFKAYKRGRLGTILQALSEGATIENACKACQIDVVTFWHWRQKYAALEEIVQKLMQGNLQLIVSALYKSAQGYEVVEEFKEIQGKLEPSKIKHYAPNVGAITFILCNRDKDNWKNPYSTKIDIDNRNLTVIDDGNKYDKVPDRRLAEEFGRRRRILSVGNNSKKQKKV